MNNHIKKYIVINLSILLIGLLCCLVISGCFSPGKRLQRISLFIGIDVSGSFYNSPYYDNAIRFTAYYIYAHVNGLGNLKTPRALFVGSIGGDTPEEPKAFHPIHDFQGKSPEQIEKDLKEWFPQSNLLTDFNVFFEKVASLTKRNNLVLAPLEIVLISDGIPDVDRTIHDEKERYRSVSFKPIEYLARRITVRLLYSSSKVSDYWRTLITRKRVKVFTQDDEVMAGWVDQYMSNKPASEQEKLLTWIKDNVDLRVPRFY
ncbi:MAG: hypothetical protein GF384_07740 [Elusimicrobia bacterium]|nr:hypothetical protein [Elusimicrobiota bacterium]